MFKRLLVLSAAIGAGHLKAAEAVCRAFSLRYPEREAVHVDFLKYCDPTVSRVVEESYYFLTKYLTGVYRFLYELEKRPEPLAKKEQVLLAIAKYRQFLREYRPDVILSTHFFPAAVISYFNHKYPIPNGIVLTDYAAHSMWIYNNIDLYFVAHPGMVQELQALGVAKEKIRITGIPVRPEFTGPFVPAALRAEKGIPPDLPVVLVMSGGNAVGPLLEVLEVLDSVEENFQVVAITGKNEKVRKELESTKERLHYTLHLPGFVEDMYNWMRLADLLISKAGGLTVSEALAAGLPMIVVRPTPGQEEANTSFLLQAGAGFYLEDLGDLKPLLLRLFRNKDKLEELRGRVRKAGKPGAAGQIIDELEKLGAAAGKSACSSSPDLL